MSEYIEKEALRQFPIRKDHYDKENGDEHYKEAVAAFNRRTNVNETPISFTSKWCDNQSVDEMGKVICLAHLAEARVPDCPYKSKEERASAKYPCSDYEEVKT